MEAWEMSEAGENLNINSLPRRKIQRLTSLPIGKFIVSGTEEEYDAHTREKCQRCESNLSWCVNESCADHR